MHRYKGFEKLLMFKIHYLLILAINLNLKRTEIYVYYNTSPDDFSNDLYRVVRPIETLNPI